MRKLVRNSSKSIILTTSLSSDRDIQKFQRIFEKSRNSGEEIKALEFKIDQKITESYEYLFLN